MGIFRQNFYFSKVLVVWEGQSASLGSLRGHPKKGW
jgi:hypothetical protein